MASHFKSVKKIKMIDEMCKALYQYNKKNHTHIICI